VADSTISVAITGDARSLIRELDKSGKKLGVFAGVTAAVSARAITSLESIGAGAVDFLAGSLGEADRLGDAVLRLTEKLGDAAPQAIELAKGFERFGLSKQDSAELAANFADFASALGLSADSIAPLTDDVLKTAGALSLITDQKPDEVIDLIGKAAAGSEKAMRALGIHVDESAVAAAALQASGKDNPKMLTDTELAAARLDAVLAALAPRMHAVADGEQDVEGKTRELQAKMESLQADIGKHLEGPYLQLLEWTSDLFSGLAALAGALGTLPDAFRGMIAPILDLLGPLARLADLLREVIGNLPLVGNGWGGGGGGGGFGGGGNTAARSPVTVNVNGGDPVETERAVLSALTKYTGRNGQLTRFD
jgi:hypothetical protein